MVQKESSQLVEPQADDDLCAVVNGLENELKTKFQLNKSAFRNLFKANNENKWNDINFTCKKNIDMLIPDFCIKQDEEAVKRIISLIEHE